MPKERNDIFMRNSCRRCYCMNNNYMNSNSMENCNSEVLEKSCNMCNYNTSSYNDNCSCGFDDDIMMDVFPEDPMLAQSYVPIQTMNETFKPCKGLKCGTIFPELVSPYSPCDSMKQIKFLENTNTIGEGCNDGRR